MALTDVRFGTEVTREGLETTIAGAVSRVADTVGGKLRDAGLKPDDITAVFLTGGSTAVLLARRSMLALAPKAQVVEGDMFGSVGWDWRWMRSGSSGEAVPPLRSG